ncbi:LacI family transcriptional regulator [Bacillus sp. J14TS2]|uniref:LacI family DNA-binding transcriptional regulator n=1 Tax=Bacillus sp. J14TS2 TaxID=2807188 RepID=UPI001B23FE5B|nr:LacI family DNA-binding transcriptional regulator [Bacillus sp. J14TS2]GIN69780.1 LacI family transcriptional regulator [Bacillus sp. J14TS2]
MNPTINDVAKVAKTSKSTVSRYLNGYSVKKETEEALKRAIKELNYHPNVNARRLVKNNTQVIGVVVDDITNIFYAGILRGIEQVANQCGYQCAYYSRTSHYQGEFGFLDLALERQVDGLIYISFLKHSAELLEKIQKLPIPVILVGGTEKGRHIENVFSVDIDNEMGVKEIVHYLYRIGHRNIAYITGPEEFSATFWRRKGYEDALKELKLDYKPEWVIPSDWSEEGGHWAMRELLKVNGFTSVIASNDEMAIGALLCAHELGFRVPKDFSIVGFDDIEVAKWVYPPLTTVKQPLSQMGEVAANALVKKLNDEEFAQKYVLIQPKLIVRHSCMKV